MTSSLFFVSAIGCLGWGPKARSEDKTEKAEPKGNVSSLFEKGSGAEKSAGGEKSGGSEKGAATEKGSSAEKLSEKIACEKLPQKTEIDLWNLAECFFKIGVNETTIQILHSISQKNPKDLDAFFTASWLIWQDGKSKGGNEELKRTQEALNEIQKARLSNPTHWEVDSELGDFYFLRLNQPEKAYPEYVRARSHYDGDYARNVPKAENGRKAAIEDRVARASERLDRKGEAVEASCRALFFDPDDSSALARVQRLHGSCVRKGVKDPRLKDEGKE